MSAHAHGLPLSVLHYRQVVGSHFRHDQRRAVFKPRYHDPHHTEKEMCCMAGVFVFWSVTALISPSFFAASPLFDVFSHHHRTLSPVVPLHDRGIVSAHPAAASYCSKRNAHAVVPPVGARLHLSSASACPVLLFCLASGKHGHHHGNHVHLLLFSARPYRLFCRRILLSAGGSSAAGRRSYSASVSRGFFSLYSHRSFTPRRRGAPVEFFITIIQSMSCSPVFPSSSLPSKAPEFSAHRRTGIRHSPQAVQVQLRCLPCSSDGH